MTSLHLRVRLVSDAVISARSATLGGHETLLHVPGATLLGACAAADYPDDPTLAWELFHSGAVRFGDALPEGPDGGPALPMPLSIHHPKGAPDARENLVAGRASPDVQFKQVREGYLGADGSVVAPATRASMRTAVGDHGRARDGFLFGVEAIAAGATFVARVDCDTPALAERVARALVGREIRVGRSRSAEFGRARVERCEPPVAPPLATHAEGRVVMLAVSDLWLHDPDTGQVTFAPAPASLGLPAGRPGEGWRFDAAASFVRTRRYTPFNGKRQLPDVERQVVRAGSVLVFTGPGRLDLAPVHAALAAGVGGGRAEGLGRVLVAPDFLSHREVRGWSGVRRPTRVEDLSPPDDDLRRWAEGLARAEQARDDAYRLAAEWVARNALRDANRLQSAQWGEVRALARSLRGRPNGDVLAELRAFVGADLRPDEERYTDVRPYPRTSTTEKAGRSTRHLANRWGRKRGEQTLGQHFVKLLEAPEAQRLDLATVVEVYATLVARGRAGGTDR